ncbi:MAG TPA: histidine kinase dimerization/phospho-acceptor domain-containing protein [Anaerolineae bacterium]|nr:histidine kinase dimerization/phospho-acceptor domain-containing protein [Anaerolineae bacterium]HQI84151.1 histidine kinase dimerization/phospho-acceptor domain-containing protein [Anaerolineae bacterium]
MNTEEQSHIYQVLYARRQDIAQAWLALMTQLSPTASEITDLQSILLKATDQLSKLLVAEPFIAEPAQKIGKTLESMDNLQPEALSQIYDMLARELVSELTAEYIAILYPRVVSLVGALSSGFYIGKAERAKTFDMNAMSMMGHDLKTPINAITGFSRVILKGIDGPITEFQQQDLTSIYDAGQKLLNMIDEVFRTTKNDAGKTNIYARAFDMADLLGDVLRVSQPILARRENVLEIRCTGELGEMGADASTVRWVLLGLLYYASRFTGKGTISLVVTREKVQEVDWFFFDIAMKKPARESSENTSWPGTKEQESSDIALITSKRFCEELGGNLMVEHGNDGLTKLIVRLPAR